MANFWRSSLGECFQEPVGMVLASDANLKVFFCSADEVAGLLLAAHRLALLSPKLALDGSVEGAVVGLTTQAGWVVLRRIIGVAGVKLKKDGTINRDATTLWLSPGDDSPKKLSMLYNKLDMSAGTWHEAVKHLQDSMKTAAASEDSTSFSGAFLGPREDCMVTATRLALLRLVQQPLDDLAALLRRAGIRLGDAMRRLLGGGGSARIVPPAAVPEPLRSDALQLLHAVCTARCQPPGASEVGALMEQLQCTEDALLAWRSLEGDPQDEGDRRQQDTPRPLAEEQATQPGSVQEQPAPQQPPTAGQPLTGGGAMQPSWLARPHGSDTRGSAASTGSGGQGASLSQPGASSSEPADPPTIHRWVGYDERLSWRKPALQADMADGFPPGVRTDADRRQLAELLLALGVVYAGSEVGWPPGLLGARMSFRPGHRHWDKVGPCCAVDLRIFRVQLPAAIRQWIVDTARDGKISGSNSMLSSSCATESGRSDARDRVGAMASWRDTAALEGFISRHCTAVQIVRDEEHGRAAFASVTSNWRQELVAGPLFARQVRRARADVGREVAWRAVVPVTRITERASCELLLYLQLYCGEGAFVCSNFPPDQLVAAYSLQVPSRPACILAPGDLSSHDSMKQILNSGEPGLNNTPSRPEEGPPDAKEEEEREKGQAAEEDHRSSSRADAKQQHSRPPLGLPPTQQQQQRTVFERIKYIGQGGAQHPEVPLHRVQQEQQEQQQQRRPHVLERLQYAREAANTRSNELSSKAGAEQQQEQQQQQRRPHVLERLQYIGKDANARADELPLKAAAPQQQQQQQQQQMAQHNQQQLRKQPHVDVPAMRPQITGRPQPQLTVFERLQYIGSSNASQVESAAVKGASPATLMGEEGSPVEPCNGNKRRRRHNRQTEGP